MTITASAARQADAASVVVPLAAPSDRLSGLAVPSLSPSTLEALKHLMLESGYVAALELAPASSTKEPDNSNPRLPLLRGLFSKGAGFPAWEIGQALSPLSLDALIDAGLLHEENDQVRASYQIQVYSGLLFFADFMPQDHPPDVVLPIGPSGKYLASVTIRERVDSALDLGCGCGIQALLMAQHARHVTATDINPRALALTRLNTSFNGISNVEVIEGSNFDPVRNCKFDLITANLPYVLSPENRYLYRDSSQGGDNAIRKIVEQMPLYLNEGGFAHVMLNWIHGARQAWWQPIEKWTRQCNVDLWLIYAHSKTPEDYAKKYLLVNEKESPDEYTKAMQSWLNWYKAQHIEQIAFGLLTLRRRTSRNNLRCFTYISKTSEGPLGKYILHLFKNQRALSEIRGTSGLLQKRLRSCNMKIETSTIGTDLARTIRGFLIQTKIHPVTSTVISQLDGKTDLGNGIRMLTTGNWLKRAKLRRTILKEIYHLLNLGMIEIVD